MDSPRPSLATAASYDEVPYETRSVLETYPELLATTATLAGMEPAATDRCRVLELGCGTGHNLIPMAESLAGGQFVGIDFSERQIAIGRQMVDAMGLTNIELRHGDIAEMDSSLGQFDYIICHGVYSWVPPAVQNKVLAICAAHLSPQGVAYISYNTYPGWHARTIVRDAMMFGARHATDAAGGVRQGREFLDFLVRSSAPSQSPYHATLSEIQQWLSGHGDSYVCHEFLEDENQPVWFHEFVDRLAAHQLRHVGEPRLLAGIDSVGPEARAGIEALTRDPWEIEQYSDFIANRSFRRSLVTHASVPTAAAGIASQVERLYVTTLVRPDSKTPQVAGSTAETFRDKNNVTFSTTDPVLKAALVSLFHTWPLPISFAALCDEIGRRLGGESLDAAARARLTEQLLRSSKVQFVLFHTRPPTHALRVSQQPLGSRVARHQARSQAVVTNLQHQTVTLNDFQRLVLVQLDGRQDQAAIVDSIERAVAGGAIKLDAGLQAAEPAQRRSVIGQAVSGSLVFLVRAALVVQ